MKVLEILQRAEACCARLTGRQISAATEKSYRATFARMLREPTLDALKADISLDTYYCRRAALHWGSRMLLERLSAKCWAAGDRKDVAAVQHWARLLVRVLDRVGPALERDPPMMAGALPLHSPASRWRKQAGSRPDRGAGSKKHALSRLPRDWDQQVWCAALEAWTSPWDRQDLDALAASLLVPVRPEELLYSVIVTLRSAQCLEISVTPVKNHGGRYGTGVTAIEIDPTKAGGPASYLAKRCVTTGGRMVIIIKSKNARLPYRTAM